MHSGEAQAASAAFTPICCGDRTFGEDRALRHEVPKQIRYLDLEASMTWSRRGTHNNMTVAIRFDAALETGQFWIRQQLRPTAQVKSFLRLVLREFDCQRRHSDTLP